jgi:hypothetical protein
MKSVHPTPVRAMALARESAEATLLVRGDGNGATFGVESGVGFEGVAVRVGFEGVAIAV